MCNHRDMSPSSNVIYQHVLYLNLLTSKLLNASKFTNMINLEQHFAPQQLHIDETYKGKLAF